MKTFDFFFRQLRRISLAVPGAPSAKKLSEIIQLTPMAPRVLLVVYDPIVDRNNNLRLSQHLHWQEVDQLLNDYIADIDECSGGLVKYQVIERIYRDEFPVKADGFRYDAQSYLDVWEKRQPPHERDAVNYHKILDDFNIIERVANNEIDEVWTFAFPYAGFYESTMAGRYAFFCNSDPLVGTSHCPRRFVIMGFSYERFGGQMLENFGHRTESIMRQIYHYARGEANLFARFTLYDKIAPGMAEVGNVHYGPNSESDYDYSNERLVPSRSDDWLNFPNFKGEIKQVNCYAWGKDPACPQDPWTRPHHKWWLKRLPKAAGRTNGISNNWWKYIVDPESV